MAGEPELRPGSEGDWVEYLQQMLEHLGHSPGAIDGDFGGSTERAVRSFQESVGLEADGVVGATTWVMLTGEGGGAGEAGGDTSDGESAGGAGGDLADPNVPDDLVSAGAPADYGQWSDEQRHAFFWQGEDEEFDEDPPEELEVAAIAGDDEGGKLGMSANEMVNMADTAWKIIERGAPSSAINSSTANVVPEVDDWQSLTGAHGPKSLRMRRINQVGWPFDDYLNVDIQIVLKFEYGATYRGGGRFIPNIYIEVPECFLGWNFDADIDIHLRNPSNSGTDDEPIARVPVSISGTISCPFWSSRVEWGYTLFGTGNWERT